MSGRTYSFNLIDITSKTVKPFTVQTSITTRIAQRVRTIGRAQVYVSGTFGVSTVESNVGGVCTGGGCVVIPVGTKEFATVPNARVLKTRLSDFQAVVGVGLGVKVVHYRLDLTACALARRAGSAAPAGPVRNDSRP